MRSHRVVCIAQFSSGVLCVTPMLYYLVQCEEPYVLLFKRRIQAGKLHLTLIYSKHSFHVRFHAQ